MAAPARTTQSLALVAADAAAASARVTQSLVLVASAGGGAAVTQALVLLASEGPEQAAARTTQSLVLVASEGPEAAVVRATQSVVLVAAPSPAPSRVTQGNILVAADRDTTGPRVTQTLVLVCSEDAAAAVEGPRTTQSLVLVGSEGAATPRVTQALVLVANGPSCPDASEGGFGIRELGRRVVRMLGEHPTTAGYWQAAEINRLINMAMVDIVRDTKMYEFISTQTTASESRYETPANAMQVFRAFLADVRIRPTTAWELDRERGDWEDSDTPARYYVNVPGAVVLDAIPDAGETLALWVTGVPDPLESVCDEPPGPPWWHLAIAYRAASMALGKYGEQGNPALSRAYRGISDDYARLLSAHVAGRLQ
jgi:hypothetical protein